MNLPNLITTARMFAIPFFIYFLSTGQYFIANTIFIIASLTDFLDGYLARKMNLVTNYGKFMDPTADKLLVFSALFMFVEQGYMSALMVIIIVSREFMVGTMRNIAIEKGTVVPAMWSGKVKTTVQMIGIIAIILCASLENLNYTLYIGWAITLMTIYSGIDYFVRMKDVFTDN